MGIIRPIILFQLLCAAGASAMVGPSRQDLQESINLVHTTHGMIECITAQYHRIPLGTITFYTTDACDQWHLLDVKVASNVRNRGVGTQLIHACLHFIAQYPCQSISWHAQPDDKSISLKDLKQFYKSTLSAAQHILPGTLVTTRVIGHYRMHYCVANAHLVQWYRCNTV